MKVLIGYFSETGNTKRIAEAMGEEAAAGGHDVQVKTVAEIAASQLGGYDIVFLGSTCHSSDIAAPVRSLLDGIPAGVTFKLAGFVTHSTMLPEGEEWKVEMYEKWAGRCPVTFETLSKEKGLDLAGYFHCQGAPSPPIEEFIRSTIITDAEQWDEYIEEVKKHPTADDIEAARGFVRNLLGSPQR